MIVVSIIGILVTVAIPNFFVALHKYKLKAAVAELHGNIGLARMAATNQNTTVTVTACYQVSPCPIGSVNSTPNVVTVFFRTAGGANVIPPMTMDSEIALTNGGGTAAAAPQDLQFNSRGFWVNTGNGNNLCVNSACPGTGQTLNLKNTNGVNYRVVVSTTGKTTWCYSADCTQ
jgi:Tfp pilus assembly protein FimT